jgi:hypothetical protein
MQNRDLDGSSTEESLELLGEKDDRFDDDELDGAIIAIKPESLKARIEENMRRKKRD